MFKIEKIDESNKRKIINAVESDVVRHVFAFHDIQFEPEHTTTYAAFEDRKLKGYVLIYTSLEFPSVVLECEEETAQELINYTPKNHFIIHAPSSLLSTIRRRFPDEKHYPEDWMLIKKGQANIFRSKHVRRLRTDNDASRLAALLSTREERPPLAINKYMDLIRKEPVYGVLINGELVSYAGSFIQLPQVWMIGGVYTHPNHRNMGYATLVTSAVTEETLKNAEAAALFVRSDNYPAVRVYEKIGYRKIGEKLWVDVGTGLRP